MNDNDKNKNECEWFTICDEKNILLEKNESNMYKITFSIFSKNNEDTVLNLLKNGQLFDLLSALNPDVIEKIIVNEDDDIHHVFITFKNVKDDENDDNDDERGINVHFSLKYNFKQNKCIITSTSQNNQPIKQIINGVENINMKNSLFISQIKLKATEKNEKTSMHLIFKLDGKKTSNFTNMYIGLYFKKLFYRFKKYFE
jgi:hypothetical protein